MTGVLIRDPFEYQFVIPGACPPKGSRVPVGKGRATRESSKRVGPWTDSAKARMTGPDGKPRASFSGPVYVGLVFVFKRPKVTEFPFPTAPSIGDVDKLTRCVLDALTKAKVIEDDRFVVELDRPRKVWGPDNVTIVRVGRATPEEAPRAVNPFALLGPEPAKKGCPARLPGGDGYQCTCANPMVCGALSVEPIPARHIECWTIQMRCEEADCPAPSNKRR